MNVIKTVAGNKEALKTGVIIGLTFVGAVLTVSLKLKDDSINVIGRHLEDLGYIDEVTESIQKENQERIKNF